MARNSVPLQRAPASSAQAGPAGGTRHSRWREIRRLLVMALFVWAIVCVVIALMVLGYGTVSYERDVDVIIVLGAGMTRTGQPGPALTRRSEEGARLYRAGHADHVICAGGIPRYTERSEAEGCAQVLQANGVPASAIILEERSRSTEENAAYSREIMDGQGWDSALIVSDGYHLLRAHWIFAEQGITGFTVPASKPPRFIDHVSSVAREVVAVHWQVLKTVLGLPYTFVPWV
ncbi:MAG: YdcF family protein [Chloroflexi bacterium]|nr:YdcF family protein [Chloroflexota bacterium]